MYLLFPDREVFQFVIAAGLVPERILGAACQAADLGDGALLLSVGTRLDRNTRAELKKQAVKISRFAPCKDELAEFGSWLQVVPLRPRLKVWDTLDECQRVLLMFETWKQLAESSRELLRLGNDRQSLRSLQVDQQVWHLLHVIEPPLYSLLALDSSGQTLAFRPLGPRTWIQADRWHPFESQLSADEGRMLLIGEQHGWLTANDEPFTDLYEQLDVRIGGESQPLQPAALQRIETVLRLRPDSQQVDAGLWVLQGDAVEQLHQLVETCDDDLLKRLLFAVTEDEDGQPTVILRARENNRLPLTMPGEAYHAYLRIPNLFVPLGRRVHPPLRRDAATRTLAPDPRQIVWLVEEGETLRPIQMADDAFQPLSDWVDYVIALERESLQAWSDSVQFEFDAFACDRDWQPPTPSDSDHAKSNEDRGRYPTGEQDQRGGDLAKSKDSEVEEEEEPSQQIAPLQPTEAKQPSAQRAALKELETKFLTLDSQLDSPKRIEFWRRMGELQFDLGDDYQASLCLSAALWSGTTEERERASRVWREYLSQRTSLESELDSAAEDSPLRPIRLMGWLASADNEDLATLQQHAPRIARQLQALESQAPVRLIWLAWLSLSRASGGDPLALSRVRDRLLARLFDEGLRSDIDLPLFLRNSDVDHARYARVREYMQKLPSKAFKWIERQSDRARSPSTALFASLYIAYGLARLGERNVDALLQRYPDCKDPVSEWVRAAISTRVRQVLQDEPADGPLPIKLLRQLGGAKFQRSSRGQQNHRYLVDRLRSESRIIEPQQNVDPNRHITLRTTAEWRHRILAIHESDDRKEIVQLIQEGLNETRSMTDQRPYGLTLAAALEAAPRLDEKTAKKLLALVPDAIGSSTTKEPVAKMIKHGLFLAGHFELNEHVEQLLKLFRSELLAPTDSASRQALDESLGECFAGLRRLGLSEEIERVLRRVNDLADSLGGRKVAASDTVREIRMKLQLHVAAGHFYFHQDKQAEEVLDAVRKAMLTGDLARQSRGRVILARMAQRYVAALRNAPVEIVLQRIDDLLTNLRGVYDNYTTSILYSRVQLTFIEEIVFVLVSDKVALSTGGGKWLDEDEHLVRRRIHADVRAALGEKER